jgi:methylated-DNA-[protein]-cysteine S-methyltransferase
MDKPVSYSYVPSPIGRLLVTAEGTLLTGLYMQGHKGRPDPQPDWQRADGSFDAVRRQLAEYFAGGRQTFDVPLRMAGTTFQQLVWMALVRIPFGTTITYAQLGARIGRPNAARAVGHANSRNPISIIVPCHRVIGADGALAGYAGGLDKKRQLLDLERNASAAEYSYLAGSTASRSANMAVKSGKS